MNGPARRVVFLRRWIGAVLVVNLFVAGMMWMFLEQSRRQYEEQSALTVANLSQVLQQNVSGTIESMDIALHAMGEEFRRQAAAGRIDVPALDRYVARLRQRVPDVDGLRLADTTGRILCGTDVVPGSAINIGDRSYFLQARDDAKAGLIVSGPHRSRISGKQVLVFARRLDGPDGRFAGVVFASVSLQQITRAFVAVDVGRRGSISLRDGDLRLLAIHAVPGRGDEMVGKTLAVPQLKALVDSGGSVAGYVTDQTVDGVERRFSARRIDDRFLYVVVGRSIQEELAPWRALAVKGGLLLLLFFLGTLVSSLMIHRVWRRQQAAAEEAAAAEEQVRRLNDELERRVAERTAQLEAANKELEEFSYSVSHDLRTPLRAIVGFSQILVEDYGARMDDEGRRLLAVVADNGRRMGLLIDGILGFLHLGRQALRPASVDMEALAKAVFTELAPAGRPVDFSVGPLPAAQADPAMIRQVMWHLLSNAVRFTARAERAEIRVGGSAGREENTYFVRDNGVGFDMRYAAKLFRVFERLHGDPELEGTGIGLATVRRIVHRHGGRVWAEGRIGEGATIYFTLPPSEGETK